MIWYIIVGIITLIAISLIISAIWEIDKTPHYKYDPQGKDRADARNLDEWENKDLMIEALKTAYAKDWERNIKYYKERDNSDPEGKTLSDMKYNSLPCKRYYTSKIQLRSYWYEEARAIAGCVIGGICVITLGVMIGTNVSNKVTWAVQEQTVKYEERITKLENNKQYILTYYTYGVSKDIDISSTNIPAVIKEHNNEVEELAQKIKVDTINLSNPWINPWVNPACKNIDLKRIVGDPNDPNDTGLYISKLA